MLEDLLQRRPYNAVTDLIDAPVERGLAGKTAFIDADRTLSYGDLQARSCRLASALADIGLRAEERLALLLYDTIDFPVAFWGGVRAGIVALPLNAAQCRAICLHPRRQPGLGDCRFGIAGQDTAADPRSPAAPAHHHPRGQQRQ